MAEELTSEAIDPRDRLVALWDALDARGAVVNRVALAALTDSDITGIAEHEARRLRALNEAS